jgi:hypothetical protein
MNPAFSYGNLKKPKNFSSPQSLTKCALKFLQPAIAGFPPLRASRHCEIIVIVGLPRNLRQSVLSML